MRKAVIEEAKNGYIVRLAKSIGDDIIESSVVLCHTIAGIQKEIEGHFISKTLGKVGYKD